MERPKQLARPLHVLIVDDQVGEALAYYLASEGHTFEMATDGEDALEMFVKSYFDVVITDLAMPGINGLKLAPLMKQLVPNKPIIMLTGFNVMMRELGEVQKSVDYLLRKPVVLNYLRSILAKISAEVNVSN